MKKYIAFLLLLICNSCISPFDVDVDEGAKILVVNGMITDEPGPYTVKLNKTTSYGGHFSDVHKDIPGATVSITDDLGFSPLPARPIREPLRGPLVRSSACGSSWW